MQMNMRGELRTDLWGLRTSPSCRTCGVSIHARDGFGLNEGVCPACRGDRPEQDGTMGRIVGGGRFAARAVTALGGRASRSLASLRRAS